MVGMKGSNERQQIIVAVCVGPRTTLQSSSVSRSAISRSRGDGVTASGETFGPRCIGDMVLFDLMALVGVKWLSGSRCRHRPNGSRRGGIKMGVAEGLDPREHAVDLAFCGKAPRCYLRHEGQTARPNILLRQMQLARCAGEVLNKLFCGAMVVTDVNVIFDFQ